jgi:hypothetical protein
MINPALTDIRLNWQIIDNTGRIPDFDTPVVILIEHDVVEDADLDFLDFPFTRLAALRANPFTAGRWEAGRWEAGRWELLDYNPVIEEQFLQQYFTVIAWRYLKPPM